MSEKFKWIVKEKIPPPVRFVRKRLEYDECLDEFLKSDLKSARVEIQNSKPKNLYRQLHKRIKEKGLEGKVRVCIRKNKVYLVRTQLHRGF